MKKMLLRLILGMYVVITSCYRRILNVLCHPSQSKDVLTDHLKRLLLLHDDIRNDIDRHVIRIEDGLHPKHRLMEYHNFFTKRIGKDDRVLDVGCGIGAVSHSMARTGAKVTGIDIDGETISTARKRYKCEGLDFVAGDAIQGVPVGEYNTVVLSNVLEHIEKRPEFLKSILEKIKPMRILIRVPMLNRDWMVLLKKELGLAHYSDVTHFTEYTEESFREEMKMAGLNIVHLEIKWGEIWAELGVQNA